MTTMNVGIRTANGLYVRVDSIKPSPPSLNQTGRGMKSLARQLEKEKYMFEILKKGQHYDIRTNSGISIQELHFQDGVVSEMDRNGIQNEEVLEVLIDRMNWLNAQSFCRENSLAITKLEEALLWLNKRTADRVNRNVEGTHAK